MMQAVEPALNQQQQRFASKHEQSHLRPTTIKQTTAVIHHKRVKSLESCFQELASCPLTPTSFESSPQDAAAQVQVQQLQRELDQVKMIYGELMRNQDDEIFRLRNLLNNLGVDGDGNPLPTGAEAVDGVY